MREKKPKFKEPILEKSKIVAVHESSNLLPLEGYPNFSLRFLDKEYCISHCEIREKASFAMKIKAFTQMQWVDIMQADKHSLGSEKIPLDSLAKQIPSSFPLPKGTKSVLALRFHKLAPMVGVRIQDTFYVIWFDRDFTLYDHG